MARNIKINLDDCYNINPLLTDLTSAEFDTILENGDLQSLRIEITKGVVYLLPQVENLAFGPLDNGMINDSIKLTHSNYSKVFSTITLHAYTYLDANPTTTLGLDGSDDKRALLYYRIIKNNYDYLSNLFHIYCVGYYIRVLRGNKTVDDKVVAISKPFSPNERIEASKMYNYFTFIKK